jgi:hypothetical protein
MDWTYLLLPVAVFCLWKAYEARMGLRPHDKYCKDLRNQAARILGEPEEP